ncbi:hypothetical protein H1R17_02375 [Flavobacterium sp. xlx-214]|uniref:DUF6056 family protein n=1 Tax=unclassified Flavobacterium TaxID=196869 RepID=UPI0013D380AB|nr:MULTISPECIES: DUF6056 family protein [unclassified Flavobacterium]MBA5794096.1 hypothetical protein [Flavobacterium sp. xlx-221]QMI84005.1 hypothetical protein H1R17_02375 [Flavobacterium sp. xlx-214]
MIKIKDFLNSKFAIILFIIIISAPLFYLSYFVYPSADDFSYAVMHNESSFFDKQKAFYFSWTSRYLATAVLSLTFLNFGSIHYYGVLSAVSILLFYLSIVYVVQVTSKTNSNKWFFSALLMSVYVLFLPSICENFFWFPSVITYFVPSSLFLIFIGVTLKNNKSPSIKNRIIAVLLIFLIGGCNELLIGAILLWLFFLHYLEYLKYRKISYPYTILTLITIAIALFVVLAPGNAVRAKVIDSIRYLSFYDVVILSFKRFFIIYLKYFVWILLLFIFANSYFKVKIYLPKSVTALKVFLVMNAFLFACIFLSIYSLKAQYPVRVENLVYFIALLFLYVFSILLLKTLKKVSIKTSYLCLSIGLSALFILPFFHKTFKNNVCIMYSDIFKGKAVSYKQQFLERDAYLTSYASKNGPNSVCKVARINNPPETLLFDDIQKDKNHFINQAIAKYYNVKMIVLKE